MRATLLVLVAFVLSACLLNDPARRCMEIGPACTGIQEQSDDG